MNLDDLPIGFRQPTTVEGLMVSRVPEGTRVTLNSSIPEILRLKHTIVRTFLWDGRIKRTVSGLRLRQGATLPDIVEEYDEFERCSKAEDWDMDLQDIVGMKAIILEYTEPSIHFCFPYEWAIRKFFPVAGEQFMVQPGEVLIPSKESRVSVSGTVLDNVLYDIQNTTTLTAENDCRICVLTKR